MSRAKVDDLVDDLCTPQPPLTSVSNFLFRFRKGLMSVRRGAERREKSKGKEGVIYGAGGTHPILTYTHFPHSHHNSCLPHHFITTCSASITLPFIVLTPHCSSPLPYLNLFSSIITSPSYFSQTASSPLPSTCTLLDTTFPSPSIVRLPYSFSITLESTLPSLIWTIQPRQARVAMTILNSSRPATPVVSERGADLPSTSGDTVLGSEEGLHLSPDGQLAPLPSTHVRLCLCNLLTLSQTASPTPSSPSPEEGSVMRRMAAMRISTPP